VNPTPQPIYTAHRPQPSDSFDIKTIDAAAIPPTSEIKASIQDFLTAAIVWVLVSSLALCSRQLSSPLLNLLDKKGRSVTSAASHQQTQAHTSHFVCLNCNMEPRVSEQAHTSHFVCLNCNMEPRVSEQAHTSHFVCLNCNMEPRVSECSEAIL